MDIEAEIDRLYALGLDAFTKERDALAKQLKLDKRGDDSARVKKLAKPNAVAWVANQLWRLARGDFAVLLEAADKLRVAQVAAIQGGGAEAVRAATERQRAALAALRAHAQKMVAEGAAPAGALGRVEETLANLAATPAAQRPVLGRLATEVASPGFDSMGDVEIPIRAAPVEKPPAPVVETPRVPTGVEEAARARREAQERLEAEVKRAREAVEAARVEARAAAASALAAREKAAQARNRAAAAAREADAAEVDARDKTEGMVKGAERVAAAENALAEAERALRGATR